MKWFCLAIVALGLGCGERVVNLIASKVPSESSGISSPERMTDGHYAFEGSLWKSEPASLFDDASAYAVYDFGDVRTVQGLRFQADNNDEFLFSLSSNGVNWSPVWRAPTYPVSGLHQRWVRGLNARARYLKLTILSGDGAFSVSELQVFGD